MAGRSKTSAAAGTAGKAKAPKPVAGIRTFEGEPGAGHGSVAVVVAKFNSAITDRLLAGAVDCLLAHGLKPSAITVAKVPGAVEIPLAAKRLAASRKYAAVVALGCVIRGDTTHYDYVCAIAAQGVLEAGLATGVPVIFGVLTTENLEQALARAGAYPGSEPAAGGGSGDGEGDNKGWDAALAALEMADLLGKIR